jgi:RNA polymerase sigma-70 factor (ECF subfamily)
VNGASADAFALDEVGGTDRARGSGRSGIDWHVREEEALILRAQEYDPEALSEIYETYYPKIHAYAYMQLGDTHAAEDLTSAVLLQVLESIQKYRPRGVPFQAWVFRIAKNRIIDLHRRKKRRPEVELVDTVADRGETPEDMADLLFESERLRVALKEIRDDQRDVITLKFMQGMDNAAIAKTLGRSEAAVKSLQHRGLVALRKILVRDIGDG